MVQCVRVSGIIKDKFNFFDSLKELKWRKHSIGFQWADACDSPNGDFESEETEKENCGKTCQSTLGCTHFVWSNGECRKKLGLVLKSDTFWTGNRKSICGILDKQAVPNKS